MLIYHEIQVSIQARDPVRFDTTIAWFRREYTERFAEMQAVRAIKLDTKAGEEMKSTHELLARIRAGLSVGT